MKFGIMFFSSNDTSAPGNCYQLLMDVAKLADRRGFHALWTPERHFHEFGGRFANPAITSAALAASTQMIRLRAGSLISPLHDTVRITEDWSMIDNLSNGRVDISFGSGWNVDDFVFFPDRYEQRQTVMYAQIEEVRRLWRGEKLTRENSYGKEVTLATFPRPVQPELPVWLTSSGNVATFESAGSVGANLLTHLIGQDVDTLAEKIIAYRKARAEAGHDSETGKVSLMLHTFMGTDVETVKAKVRTPFREYLRSGVSLEIKAARGGGAISGGHIIEDHQISEQDMEDLLDLTFERYFQTGALMGTPESCRPFVARLEEIGVNEVACLVDFLDDGPAILASLEHLARLIEEGDEPEPSESEPDPLGAFMEELD